MITIGDWIAANPDADRSRLIGLAIVTSDNRSGVVNHLEHDARGQIKARLHDPRRADLKIHVAPIRSRRHRRQLPWGVFVEERFCWYELADRCIITD